MRIILSAAMSQDGYLDDATPDRRIFSCAKDMKEVEKLRASCDAVLVGAETVRKDNPSLTTKIRKFAKERKKKTGNPDPIKVTITASGDLDKATKFFQDGTVEKLVYCTDIKNEALAGLCTMVAVDSIEAMLADLEARGIETLLVEGGVKILEQFLTGKFFDEFRLAVAPVRVGDARASSLCHGTLPNSARAISKIPCGEMEVIRFVPAISV